MKYNYRRKNVINKHAPNLSIYLTEKFVDGTVGSVSSPTSCHAYNHSRAHQKKSDKHTLTAARRRAHKRYILNCDKEMVLTIFPI